MGSDNRGASDRLFSGAAMSAATRNRVMGGHLRRAEGSIGPLADRRPKTSFLVVQPLGARWRAVDDVPVPASVAPVVARAASTADLPRDSGPLPEMVREDRKRGLAGYE